MTEFRASRILFLGGGINWLIGESVVLGLSALSDLPIGGDETGLSLELGAQVEPR